MAMRGYIWQRAVLVWMVAAAIIRAASGSVEGGAGADEVVSRFRIGPFFEYRETRGGGTFWAVRPFYSKLNDPVSETRVTDAVWPLATFHRSREQLWWRVALAYGSDQDVDDPEAAWKMAIFPLYFQGRTRYHEDYWALFPIYGHLPHVLLMDDIDFVLFPIYLDYEVNKVERRYYLWPIFSQTDAEPRSTTGGIFPFYGYTKRRKARHDYTFWPFWTSAVYEPGNNPGRSWMLFPLAGRVDREREQQKMFLPPFFSYAKTDTVERWRMPWPIYESYKTFWSQKYSVWPFCGDLHTPDERRVYAAWPLFQSFTLRAGALKTERTRLFPFYVNERITRRDAAGYEREESAYTRVWPFYASEREHGVERTRALEFNLIRYSGGIERNWAPFWTLYERVKEVDGSAKHDMLWGIIKYQTGSSEGEDKR